MNRQVISSVMAAACTLVAAVFSNPAVAVDDGTTGTGSNRYLSHAVTWSQDYRYDTWGPATTLSVGTGAGAGQLTVQDGARVEVANALFIGGKGYASPYAVADGHDGLVTVERDSVLAAGTQSPYRSGAHTYVGWSRGAKGTLRVEGGEFISDFMLHVGSLSGSNGLLEVTDGGRVTVRLGEQIVDSNASFFNVATAAGSQGLVRLDGGSSLGMVAAPGEQTRADIGSGGQGTLLVEGGSTASLGQDFALVGYASGSKGLVHVREGSVLELPMYTYMGREAGSRGTILIEGNGSRLQAQGMAVGEQGQGLLELRDGATGEVSGMMSVGAGTGTGSGKVSISGGAQLANAAAVEVGSSGSVQLSGGGRWVTSAPVTVQNRGQVSLSGASSWQLQDSALISRGGSLTFAVNSIERVPEVVVSAGQALTMAAGSRMVLTLSPSLLTAARNGVELPLIKGEGDFVGADYEFWLRDATGLFESGGMELLSDGSWGVSLRLDRKALQSMLVNDAARLSNGLWSSSSVVSDYTSSLLDRPVNARCRHVWVMGLGSFSRMQEQGAAPGFDYNGGGYALGADACLNQRTALGLSFGQVYGTNTSSDDMTRIRQNSLMGALYGRYKGQAGTHGRLVMDAYAAYGRTNNHARSSMYNTPAVRSQGQWWDDTLVLGLRTAWEMAFSEQFQLIPFAGLRYVHGSHGALTMSSADDSRDYSSASLQQLSLPVGVSLRSLFWLSGGHSLTPELTLAYVGDVSRRNPHMSTSMLGEFVRAQGANPGRHAFLLRAGMMFHFNEHWSAATYYHLECRRHDVGQAANMSVSYGF